MRHTCDNSIISMRNTLFNDITMSLRLRVTANQIVKYSRNLNLKKPLSPYCMFFQGACLWWTVSRKSCQNYGFSSFIEIGARPGVTLQCASHNSVSCTKERIALQCMSQYSARHTAVHVTLQCASHCCAHHTAVRVTLQCASHCSVRHTAVRVTLQCASYCSARHTAVHVTLRCTSHCGARHTAVRITLRCTSHYSTITNSMTSIRLHIPAKFD
jgi:hypothetical protein